MITQAITVATWLTISRLILSPIVLPLLLVYGLSLNVVWINGALALLFLLLSLTDFFDGYIARRYHQESVLGSVLDPIADKFLIYSTIISLLAVHKIQFYWVLVLIGREFFVMALRHVALEHNFNISVSLLGKIKTLSQMIVLAYIIVNPYCHLPLKKAYGWNGMGVVLLSIATSLSLYSAYKYYKIFMKKWGKYVNDAKYRNSE